MYSQKLRFHYQNKAYHMTCIFGCKKDIIIFDTQNEWSMFRPQSPCPMTNSAYYSATDSRFLDCSVNSLFYLLSNDHCLRLRLLSIAVFHFHSDKSNTFMNDFTHTHCCRVAGQNFGNDQKTVFRRDRSRRGQRDSRRGLVALQPLVGTHCVPAKCNNNLSYKTCKIVLYIKAFEQRSLFSNAVCEYGVMDLSEASDAAQRNELLVFYVRAALAQVPKRFCLRTNVMLPSSTLGSFGWCLCKKKPLQKAMNYDTGVGLVGRV